MTKVAHTSTTSTDPAQASALPRRVPGASGHQPIGPRPALPTQAPAVQHLPHDLPTAAPTPGSFTRAQLDAAIRKAEQGEPRPYDAIVLGQPHAWGAF